MKKPLFLLLFLCFALISFSQSANDEITWDTIQFNEAYEYLNIDTSVQNFWQIGNPQKIFLDSAYSFSKAIITDTANSYPVNGYSYFDILIGQFNYAHYYPHSIFVEFKHKFDTDTLNDGGYITVSFDNGTTWENVIDSRNWCIYPSISNENLYTQQDTLFNGERGFSGNSGEWVTTWFSFQMCVTNTKSTQFNIGDTTILRFNFISDNSPTNHEGWLIDDIRLYSKELIGDINNTKNEHLLEVYPNPTNSNTFLKLNKKYNTIDLKITDINGRIIESKNYKEKREILLDDLESFQAGIYLIELVLNNQKRLTHKIVIE